MRPLASLSTGPGKARCASGPIAGQPIEQTELATIAMYATITILDLPERLGTAVSRVSTRYRGMRRNLHYELCLIGAVAIFRRSKGQGPQMPYEVDFLSVGDSNGDAICLRYGNHGTRYTIHVVDGGYTDTGQVVVDHINTFYGRPTYIDHVVLSHADRDHAGGVATILESFDIGSLWMNRPWLYAEEIVERFHGNYTVQGLRNRIREEYPLLVELERIAERRGIRINEAFAGHQIGAFRVLAPLRDTYLSLIPEFDRTPTSKADSERGIFGAIREIVKEVQAWFESWADEKLSDNPPATSASNESCVVQMAILDNHRLVLTADAGPKALTEAVQVATHYEIMGLPKFFQIPHHGSRRNVTPTVLNQWLGGLVAQGSPEIGVAYCSVGTNKPEYPRHRVRNAFLRRGFGVYPCRGGWINYHSGFGDRPNTLPLASETFQSFYEE